MKAEDLGDLSSEKVLQGLHHQLKSWFSNNGFEANATAVVAKPAVGSSAAGVKLCTGVDGALSAIVDLKAEVSQAPLRPKQIICA